MGRYINWDDIVARYPSINAVGGAADVGSAWIGYVENQVDGLLSPEFSAPFSNNNITVKDLCIELTYIRVGNLKVEETTDMREAFMERINRLKDGSEGMLTNSCDIVLALGDTVYSNTANYNPVFNLDNPLDWEVDSTLLDSLENAK